MPEPCRSCDRRTEDFGGCRCQALLLAGDATVTDPACSLAPAHHIVESALAEANSSAAMSPTRFRFFIRAVTAAHQRTLELPHQSGIDALAQGHARHQRTPSVIGRTSVVVPFPEPCIRRNSA